MDRRLSTDVTIVVVPRERFSLAPQSLRSVLENTEPPYKLVYVDGGSPRWVRHIIESQAKEHNFTLIRSEQYLSPNEARNLGFAKVQTKYALFLDNDVVVAPGWLNGLVRCAEETGAWVVGPLYCIGQPYHQKIHMAGGLAHFEENGGTRRYIDRHLMGHSWLSDVRDQLRRGSGHCNALHLAFRGKSNIDGTGTTNLQCHLVDGYLREIRRADVHYVGSWGQRRKQEISVVIGSPVMRFIRFRAQNIHQGARNCRPTAIHHVTADSATLSE